MSEETISLEEIFLVIRRRLNVIIAITFLCFAISAFITFVLITPKYQATSQILVNKESGETDSSQLQNIQSDLQLINTYSVILKGAVILNEVIENLDLNMKASTLGQMLKVSNEQNSKVMNVTITHDDPKMAVAISNEITQVFYDNIEDLMNVDNVKIIMEADIDDSLSPVSPNTKLNLAIGFVLGGMLGIGLAFLLEFLDKTFRSEKEVEDLLGVPVLGTINEMTSELDVTNKNRANKTRSGR